MVPKGVSINHPLGFIWHPLEGAGIYIYIPKCSMYGLFTYIWVVLGGKCR